MSEERRGNEWQMEADELSRAKLWTLYRPHKEPVTGYGHIYALPGWLDEQWLPGTAPSDWIADLFLESIGDGHFSYTHDAGGASEWTLVIAPTMIR